MLKPKVILFDVDGVLIRLPHYFSKELESGGYEHAGEIMNPFYLEENNSVYNEGRGDAWEMVVPYLDKLGWRGTAKELFDGQFQFEKKYLDQDLISLVKNIKSQNIKCCLTTDQEKHRAQFLLEDMDFRNIFDRHYLSCNIGFRKCAEGFWEYVLDDLQKHLQGIQPWDIIYFDDAKKNIEIASQFGIRSFLFTDKVQFENDMNMLGFDITLNKYF